MNGKVSYSDVSPGYYSLTVVLKNSNYDTLVVKRLITVPDSSYSCAVNLVNNGFTISDGTVTLQFAGVGQVTGYACYLDGQVYGSDCEFRSDVRVQYVFLNYFVSLLYSYLSCMFTSSR